MFPASIEAYSRPSTIDEALAEIAKYDDGECLFLAGGQSLMQAIKSRMVRPRGLVDLQAISELKGIDTNAGLRIGAMTRYIDIARSSSIPNAYAAIADAAQHVGDRQVRNRGTIGGSLCWNFVASCTPCAALGTGARLNLLASDGTQRQLAAAEFLLGAFETAREDNEILVSVEWPEANTNTGSAYKKWGLVSDALPVVGVCISVSLDSQGLCSDATIAIAGLADGGQLSGAGRDHLIGSDGNSEAVNAALGAVAAAVETHDDHWASAAYREQLIQSIGADVAASAFARARA